MSEIWYAVVEPGTELTQGDIILNCPLIGWKSEPVEIRGSLENEVLKQALDPFAADVVVMTQACDLEQYKVDNVVVCPHLSLSDYKRDWEESMKAKKQEPTQKAWTSECKRIVDGLVFNLTILNSLTEGPLLTEHRIVDFHDVFTLPRSFLESLMRERKQSRLRLLPPYREHLSQSFARFFMRVGLPTPIKAAW